MQREPESLDRLPFHLPILFFCSNIICPPRPSCRDMGNPAPDGRPTGLPSHPSGPGPGLAPAELCRLPAGPLGSGKQRRAVGGWGPGATGGLSHPFSSLRVSSRRKECFLYHSLFHLFIHSFIYVSVVFIEQQLCARCGVKMQDTEVTKADVIPTLLRFAV